MNEMNMALILFILVVVVLLLVVIIMLLNRSQSNSNKVHEEKKNKEFKVEMPSAIGLFLPPAIEKIGQHESLDIARKVYELYKYFDYKNMSLDELDKHEWHSWQISLLLLLLKYDEEFFIPNQDEVFHPFLLNSNENDVKSLMNGILRKYKNQVDIDFTKDNLCKNYIWSNRDISIIFYFLSNYKNYSK